MRKWLLRTSYWRKEDDFLGGACREGKDLQVGGQFEEERAIEEKEVGGVQKGGEELGLVEIGVGGEIGGGWGEGDLLGEVVGVEGVGGEGDYGVFAPDEEGSWGERSVSFVELLEESHGFAIVGGVIAVAELRFVEGLTRFGGEERGCGVEDEAD